jgi:hypothetical protein
MRMFPSTKRKIGLKKSTFYQSGQAILVDPDKNLVAVVTSWPYVQNIERWKDSFEYYLYKLVIES